MSLTSLVTVPEGVHVVAVSGGVDSMVLLDVLRQQPNLKLVVAHFDHGIRPDSRSDHDFVQDMAAQLDIAFESAAGNLGPTASEETARQARYEFLNQIKERYNAQSIITAHHQDDVIESIIMNVLRGTGRKGLSSLRSTDAVLRPLVHVPKSRLKAYAHAQQLTWREDSTNTDTRYFRNHIRRHIVPLLSPQQRAMLVRLHHESAERNVILDQEIAKLLQIDDTPNSISRHRFVSLPHQLATDAMAVWLRANHLRDFDAPMIERLVVAAKTLPPGRSVDVMHGYSMRIGKNSLTIGSQVRR